MSSAKVFKSGNSQAVRLPKEFQIKDKEFHIRKIGDVIMLIPKSNPWGAFRESLDMFDESFMNERNQSEQQNREEFA